MQEEIQSRTAQDSPKSAARFVRRGAASIRAGAQGLSQYRAEYQSLIDWADETGRRLPFSFIEQFDFVGEGAEHRVYKKAAADSVAVKSTLPNKFGYSTQKEGAWASPAEYLKRLAWQNLLFCDDIRVVGVAYEDGQMEVITSQPWISVHEFRPNPRKEEIDKYMGECGFISTSFDLDTPLYFSVELGLLAADAHDRNILRDTDGKLTAIDLIIGPPSELMRGRIRQFLQSPEIPF